MRMQQSVKNRVSGLLTKLNTVSVIILNIYSSTRSFNLKPREQQTTYRRSRPSGQHSHIKFQTSQFNPLTPSDIYSGRTAPLTSKFAFYIFIQQIQLLNILNMVYTLLFFSSKCSLFNNSNVFGSFIIHILYTECAKIKKNNSGAKRLAPWFRHWPS